MKYSTFVVLFIAVIFSGCSGVTSVVGTSWNVQKIGQRVLEADPDKGLPTVVFDAEGNRVSGFAGCNRYSGGYSLTGNALRFGSIASTKMACDNSATEDEMMLALASIQKYSLEGNKLILQGADGKGILECLPMNK